MASPRIVVVVLNTNRRDDTLDCLQSLARGTYRNVKVVVLDNASTDGSVEAIRDAHPEVEVLALAGNLGYAGNNNAGIRHTLSQGADWVLVLNEDTVLHPACLAELAAAGVAHERIGVVGPMVYHHDEPDVIQSAGGELAEGDWASVHVAANEPDRGQFVAPRDVSWVSGCAIMMRREALEDVGGFDDRFFYYWEETEWCQRARRAGWRAVHVPAARLWHKGVQRDYVPSPSVSYYNARNRLLMLSKLDAPVSVRALAWGGMLRTLASMTLRPRWRHARPHRDALWQGMRDHLRGRYGRRPD